jgi:putative ABC transport system permease protein
MAVMVRSSRDLRDLAAPLRRAVASVDPGQPIYGLEAMDQVIADAFGPKRLTMLLLVFFATVTSTLSALGLYALIAYSVGQRTHEIGVRMTVGATPRDIRTLVLRRGARLAGAGIVFGLAAALAATRLMESLLYGVSPTDPLLLAGVTAVLSLIALLAADVPSRRAARVQPMDALRIE